MTDTRPKLTLITGGQGHEIMPDPHTVKRTVTGEPASVLDAAAYPLLAICSGCAEPIRCPSFYGDWQHMPEPVPGPRGEVGR
jgi:hypothetical protein